MKRSTGLRRDSAKSQEFASKRSALARGRKPRPKEGPLDAGSWRRAVYEASGGWCKLTRTRAYDADDRRYQAHHPLPKRELRARGLHAFVWDPRNGLWVRADVHMQHETPGVRPEHRIAHEALPASVWEFCRELDELAGHPWATELVRRLHPAAAAA